MAVAPSIQDGVLRHDADEYFEYLAQRLLRPYRIAGVSCIAVIGPHVKLAPGEAKMLALRLHELATKANAERRMAVMLSAPQSEQPACFSWVERGGPEVTLQSRQGYGTQFVISTIEGIFGNKVTMDYRPEGLSVTVSGPATGAVRRRVATRLPRMRGFDDLALLTILHAGTGCAEEATSSTPFG